MILLLVIAVILFYFFFLNGAYTRENIVHQDIMNLKVFDFPLLENCCSVWPLSHFFLFFVLGVLFPDCGIPLLSLGVLWEGFEVFCSSLNLTDRQIVRDHRGKNSKIEYSGDWWAGSMKDIVMNVAGFVTGWLVAKKLGGKTCIDGLNSCTKWCRGENFKYNKKDRCVRCADIRDIRDDRR